MPLARHERRPDRVSGLHTLFIEELGVQPGDFVTYLRARARRQPRPAVDRSAQRHLLPRGEAVRGRVRRRAEPGDGQGGGGERSGLEARRSAEGNHRRDLEARRARRGARATRHRSRTSRRSRRRRRSCARAPSRRARRSRARRRSAPAPRLPGAGAAATIRCGRAVEAMGRAVSELDKLEHRGGAAARDGGAQPAAQGRRPRYARRQVTRQQQAGGGGGANRSEADLSCAVRSGAAQAAADQLRDAELDRGSAQDDTSRTIRSTRFASSRGGRTRSTAQQRDLARIASRSKKRS